MDNCYQKALESALQKKLNKKAWASSCLHVPATCIVGYGKHDCNPEAAAISTRWLYEKWTNPTQFNAWTGFMPSTSKSGEVEILKAAGGKVFQFENVPTDGFKLVSRPHEEADRYMLDSRCGILKSNGGYVTAVKQGSRTYTQPTLEVRDPRGWTFFMAADQVLALLSEAEKRGISCNGLSLPGPLVYVFSNSGFTLDFIDGKLVKEALSDEEVLACKSAAKKARLDAEPVVGEVYVSNGVRYMYVGKLPRLEVGYKLHTSLNTELENSLCKAVNDALREPGWRQTRAMHETLSLLAEVGRSAVDSLAKACPLDPEAKMPWRSKEYIEGCKKLREQLDSSMYWTFVKLGPANKLNIDIKSGHYVAVQQNTACLHAFFSKSDIDAVYGNASLSCNGPWLWDIEDIKQTKSLSEARDLATCELSKDKTYVCLSTYKHPYAVISVEALLEAANKRKAWFKQSLDTLQMLFPTTRPNIKNLAEYGLMIDKLLAKNPMMWKLLCGHSYGDIAKLLGFK